MAPRPGGDCLPPLLRAGYGVDILGLTLDIAEGAPLPGFPQPLHPGLAGLRLFAPLPGGVITILDAELLLNDTRVIELTLTKKPGDRIVQPPEDYFSRILGYALYIPYPGQPVELQSTLLLEKLKVSYTPGQ